MRGRRAYLLPARQLQCGTGRESACPRLVQGRGPCGVPHPVSPSARTWVSSGSRAFRHAVVSRLHYTNPITDGLWHAPDTDQQLTRPLVRVLQFRLSRQKLDTPHLPGQVRCDAKEVSGCSLDRWPPIAGLRFPPAVLPQRVGEVMFATRVVAFAFLRGKRQSNSVPPVCSGVWAA